MASTSLLIAAAPARQPGARHNAVASSPISSDILIYRMKPGDNLYTIAQKFLVSAATVKEIQRLNHIAEPRSLPVGTLVKLPRRLLKYKAETARLLSWRGEVAVGNAPPAKGMELGEGTSLATGPGGFVTLQLANGSRISIPSQTKIRIARLREYHINGALDYEITVDKGRLQTKATPFKNPDSQYRVRTPVAVSAVRGTEFRIKLEDEAPSVTEVLEGNVAVGPEGVEGEQISKGVGIAVSAGGSSSKENLLPPPTLENPGRVQKEPTLSFTLAPVAGAAGYRAVFATDASMVDQFREITSATPLIELPAIANGKYFVRILALSAQGFEGFSNSYGFSRRLSTVSGSSRTDNDGSIVFKWDAGGQGKILHRFQLYRDSVDSIPFIDEPGLTSGEIKLVSLPPGIWFWRVGISVYEDGIATDNWTTPEKLTIAREE